MARAEYEEPFKSNLPIFEAKRSKDFPSFLIVDCPRANCAGTKQGRPFLVHGPTWLRPQRVVSVKTQQPIVIIGRPCPYCSGVSRLPSRSDIG